MRDEVAMPGQHKALDGEASLFGESSSLLVSISTRNQSQ